MFKELYNYRQLLKSNVRKEIRGKYKGSFLGVLWSFVNPLLMTLVYAIIFPYLLRNNQDNYIVFLIIAILPWNWFTNVIAQGTSSIVMNGGIIKKVFFPREILPLSTNISGLVNYLISCIIIAIFLSFSGIGFSQYIIFLPIIIIIQFILLQGIIFITSAINVYVRDAEYIINFLIMMLFYGTPILYSTDMFPESIRRIISLNPMASIIESYRDVLYYQQMPNFLNLGIILILSIILLLIGSKVFKKLQRGFAEEL